MFAVSLNTIRELRQHRLVVVALLLLVLSCLGAFKKASEYRNAMREESSAVASRLRADLIAGPVEGFTFLACGIGLILGSTVLSKELRSRVVHTILSRPITRTQFVVGKLAGTLTVALAFSILATGLGALLVKLFAIAAGPVFWVGLCQSIVQVFFLTVVSASFSLCVRPALAGGLALFLILLPDGSAPLMDHWSTPLRWLATALYYVTPVVLPGDPLRDGLTDRSTAATLDTYVLGLLANVLYAVCWLLVALIYFDKRKDAIGE